MKILLLLLTVFSMSFIKAEESKYENAMNKALSQYQVAKTSQEMLATSALFERIGDAEKDKWLPFYYAALSNNMAAWMDEKSDKDKLAEKSITLIEKAEALEKNNSEIFLLRQMAATLQMSVNPMTRWKTYGAKASEALENAKKANPNNPRIYFLEGQSVFNTPKSFGGGAKNAKPLFEQAVKLFESFVPETPLHPSWGKDDAANMLKECEK